jgi:hypothetical protein
MIYFVVKFQSHPTLTVSIIIFIFQYYIALLLIAWRPATNLSWLFMQNVNKFNNNIPYYTYINEEDIGQPE